MKTKALQNPTRFLANQPALGQIKERVSPSAFTVGVPYCTHTHCLETTVLTAASRAGYRCLHKGTQGTPGLGMCARSVLYARIFVHMHWALTERRRARWEKADASSRQAHNTVLGPLGRPCEPGLSGAWNPASTQHASAESVYLLLAGVLFFSVSLHVLYICNPHNAFSFFSRGKVKAVSFLLPMDMSSYAENQGSLKSPQNQSTKQLTTITEKDMW